MWIRKPKVLHMTMRLSLAAIVAISIAGAGGCKHYMQHPGAMNTFDSQTYDALVAADGAIKKGKADFAAGVMPPALVPFFNDLIRAYDAADASYKIYHAAAVKGQDTVAQANALENAMTDLSHALSNFQTFSKTPAPSTT